MSKSVVLVDYGVGNIKSVARALESAGAKVQVSREEKVLLNADRIVLPGVGAFGHCLAELKKYKLYEPLERFFSSEKPFLGICVGMQLLLDTSFEFGEHKGFGIIPGAVKKIPVESAKNKKLKLPHVGWNQLVGHDPSRWKRSPLKEIEQNEHFYFIHSYYADIKEPQHIVASTFYDKIEIPALISHNTIFGSQFHPEKSGAKGIQFIESFLKV